MGEEARRFLLDMYSYRRRFASIPNELFLSWDVFFCSWMPISSHGWGFLICSSLVLVERSCSCHLQALAIWWSISGFCLLRCHELLQIATLNGIRDNPYAHEAHIVSCFLEKSACSSRYFISAYWKIIVIYTGFVRIRPSTAMWQRMSYHVHEPLPHPPVRCCTLVVHNLHTIHAGSRPPYGL